MTHLKKVFFVLLALTWAFFPRGIEAQSGVILEEPSATVNFGKSIVFRAKLKAAQPIRQALLFFRPESRETTQVQNAPVAEDGSVSYVYDASQNLLPPFGKILFWFQATLQDGSVHTTQTISFRYDDTRFPWRTTQRANVSVHWYAASEQTTARALDMAGISMIKMSEIVNVSLSEPIHIYIYSNPADLQATLALGGKEWVGGHAAVESGAALVAIPPEAPLSEVERLIPHEMTHLLLYRALGKEKYNRQPEWLREGLASMMEQYPDPEYGRALQNASAADQLIPFAELCGRFPPDSGRAYLAYAQSQSFVRYLHESAGVSGISRLLNAYGDGLNCEVGTAKALGLSLSQLDALWRENVLRQNRLGVAVRNLAPFVLMVALVSIVPLWSMIDLVRKKRKRDETYAGKPKFTG